MNNTSPIIGLVIMLSAASATAISSTNTLPPIKAISIQTMLTTGSTPMKMHALSTISRGKIKGQIDATFLPGFKACAKDESNVIRSLAASMLGRFFIKNVDTPNPEAVIILEQLALDGAADVRFNALYHGLTEIQNKSDQLIRALIDAAAINREEELYEKIIASLGSNKALSSAYLDDKLREGSSIAYYEIYKDLMGERPSEANKYQDQPSSQPQLYVFTTKNDNKEEAASRLANWTTKLGIESYNVEVSGYAGQRVLLLTTYITRDNESVMKHIPEINEDFEFLQKFWLTSKLSTEIELVRRRESK